MNGLKPSLPIAGLGIAVNAGVNDYHGRIGKRD